MSGEILIDRYILEEIVGEGSYSIVFRGYDQQDKKKVAIKELKSAGMTADQVDDGRQPLIEDGVFLMYSKTGSIIPPVPLSGFLNSTTSSESVHLKDLPLWGSCPALPGSAFRWSILPPWVDCI